MLPLQYSPAMPHELPLSVPFPVLFATMLWNAMDFPAGVVPVCFELIGPSSGSLHQYYQYVRVFVIS